MSSSQHELPPGCEAVDGHDDMCMSPRYTLPMMRRDIWAQIDGALRILGMSRSEHEQRERDSRAMKSIRAAARLTWAPTLIFDDDGEWGEVTLRVRWCRINRLIEALTAGITAEDDPNV